MLGPIGFEAVLHCFRLIPPIDTPSIQSAIAILTNNELSLAGMVELTMTSFLPRTSSHRRPPPMVLFLSDVVYLAGPMIPPSTA